MKTGTGSQGGWGPSLGYNFLIFIGIDPVDRYVYVFEFGMGFGFLGTKLHH